MADGLRKNGLWTPLIVLLEAFGVLRYTCILAGVDLGSIV